ncbi:MAG: GNAT family N-acetyltransferase, partial [Pseudomonadales bacterium]|nr:GNAT family N-acetyltransferase [Pseudomonadales bacterium]
MSIEGRGYSPPPEKLKPQPESETVSVEKEEFKYSIVEGTFNDSFAIADEENETPPEFSFTNLFSGFLSDEVMQRAMRNSGSIVEVAIDESGKKIGYIHYLTSEIGTGQRWIKTLFVKKDYHRRGIGTAL